MLQCIKIIYNHNKIFINQIGTFIYDYIIDNLWIINHMQKYDDKITSANNKFIEMNDLTYKLKYLKYKLKYFKLKKLFDN
jgi:hypothetical protein